MKSVQPPADGCRERRWTTTASLWMCALWLTVFLAAGSHLTRGFQWWTFEEVRRDDARRLAITAPPTALETASGDRIVGFPPSGGATGAAYVVDFIYTQCETVCLVLGIEFHQMQEQIRRTGSKVQLLSVSIDRVRDEPAALARFARFHRADAATWTLARPATADGSRTLLQALGVIAIPDGFGGFVHNGAIHVFDGRHRLRAIYDYPAWAEALAHATALTKDRQP